MSNSRKTKAELLNELAELQQEVTRLKAIEAECFELKQQMSARGLSVLTDVTECSQAEAMLAKRADALETVVRVSTAALTALEVDKLLQEVADLTKERFGLYHAHIYLLDEVGEALQLVAGAGEAGRQMVAEGWNIPFEQGQSPVVRAAWDAEGVIVNNVREDPGWLPHPLLPDTRSEMAVPLMIGGLVLGVLDVLSDQVNFFSEEDVHIHSMMAAQIGVALENADQHERMRAVLGEAEESQALLRSIIDATPDWIFVKDQEHRYRLANQGYANALHLNPGDFIGKNDLELGFPEELVKGNPEKGIRGFWTDDRLVMDSGETQIYPDDPATIDGVVHTFHTIRTPLRDANGEIWGVLAFARDITEHKLAEAERERLLAEVEATYRQYVRQEWERTLTGRGGEWRVEHQQAGLSTEPNPNGVGKATVEAPVILRGQQIGSLKLEDIDPDRNWSPEELALLNTVSEQLALTVENLRLFEDTQKRATREQLTRQITEKMRNAPDVDSIVETGLTELAKALGVARTYVKFTSSFEQQEEQQSPESEIEAIRTKLKHNGREGAAPSALRQRKGTDISDQVEEI